MRKLTTVAALLAGMTLSSMASDETTLGFTI